MERASELLHVYGVYSAMGNDYAPGIIKVTEFTEKVTESSSPVMQYVCPLLDTISGQSGQFIF